MLWLVEIYLTRLIFLVANMQLLVFNIGSNIHVIRCAYLDLLFPSEKFI